MIYFRAAPSSAGFFMSVAGGTLWGICQGVCNRECFDSRSTIKCGLRSVIYSATVASISTVAFEAFALAAVNTNPTTMRVISSLCIISQLIGPNIFDLSELYEQKLKNLLDHLISGCLESLD